MAQKTQKPDQYTTKNKNNPRNIESDNKSIFFLLPILFIVCILPLIMRLHTYNAHLSDNVWFSSGDEYVDFFLYYKQRIFISLSALMTVIAIYINYKDRKKLHYPFVFLPLVFYALLILLSTLMSKYRYYGFHGVFEQFESVFVLLGYCLTAYYVFLIVKTEEQIRYILIALLIGSLILGFLGLSQITGNDFFTTIPGWRMITSRGYWSSKDLFSFNFPEMVYLTLFNPNYVGSYAALVLPVLLISAAITKKRSLQIAYLVGAVGISIALIGSKSATGIIGIIFGCFLTLILFRKKIFKNIKISLIITAFLIIGLIILNFTYNNFIINQFQKITNIEKSTPALSEIQTNDNNLIVKYNGNTLQIDFYINEDGTCMFNVYDDAFMPVNHTSDVVNGPVTLQDNRFPGFVLTPCTNEDGALAFSVTIDGYSWYFTNQVLDHTYYYINDYGKYDKMMTAPSALFTGYEKYATRRGYIWSRTIPLLKDRIILGSGADSFVFAFPNQDYVNIHNAGFVSELINKPHNIYLQIGVQSGVLSLVCWLAFYLIYFISSIKLYFNSKFTNYSSYIGAAVLISTAGYMVSGLANDSCITVSPIFWVMMGLGITINHIVKNKTISEN